MIIYIFHYNTHSNTIPVAKCNLDKKNHSDRLLRINALTFGIDWKQGDCYFQTIEIGKGKVSVSAFQVETEILSTLELVWWAWTRSDRIVQWFAPEAHIEPRLGGAFELFFNPANREQMGTKGCLITHFEPQERLGFTWKGPDDFAALMNHDEALTYVLVSMAESEGKTRVVVEHYGWMEGEEWEKARAWHQMAWTHALASLKSAIEEGKGELCCVPQENAV